MQKLAILILTKNEEKNIVDAIKNAQQCSNDIIIIDSGSTDNTVELAEMAGARVYFRAWDNDFAAQRNFGLSKTDAAWVLYLDADERMNDEMIKMINNIISEGKQDFQYELKRKSVAFGKMFNYGVLKPDFVRRMFPRNSVTWINKVHEKPVCALPCKTLAGYLKHYTYITWEQWQVKFCNYTTIWADEAYANGKRVGLMDVLGHSVGAFMKMFVLRLGFLDGLMGSYLCLTHFFYTMIKYLKLYQRQHRGE